MSDERKRRGGPVQDRTKRAVLRVFPQAGRVKRRLTRTGVVGDERLRTQVRRLSARVAALEAEVQEARRLNKRAAELVDVVTEVLLTAEQRDDESLRAALSGYVDGL
jgi:hypothetical protein